MVATRYVSFFSSLKGAYCVGLTISRCGCSEASSKSGTTGQVWRPWGKQCLMGLKVEKREVLKIVEVSSLLPW